MKIRISLILFISLFSATATMSANNKKVHIIGGVQYTFKEVLINQPILGSKMYGGMLAHDHEVTVYGTPYLFKKDSYLFFMPDTYEHIWSGTLAQDVKITFSNNTYVFRGDHKIDFSYGEISACLSKNQYVHVGTNRYRMAGGPHPIYRGSSAISIDQEGNLLEGRLAKGHSTITDLFLIPPLQQSIQRTINGQKYHLKKGGEIQFYKDGSIKSGVLYRNHEMTINGQKYHLKKGSRTLGGGIQFYKDGSIKSGTLYRDHEVLIGGRQYTFVDKADIHFYNSGEVHYYEKTLTPYKMIKFYKDGSIAK